MFERFNLSLDAPSPARLSSRSDKLIYVLCIPAVTYFKSLYLSSTLPQRSPLRQSCTFYLHLTFSPYRLSRAVCPQLEEAACPGPLNKPRSHSLTLDTDDVDNGRNVCGGRERHA